MMDYWRKTDYWEKRLETFVACLETLRIDGRAVQEFARSAVNQPMVVENWLLVSLQHTENQDGGARMARTIWCLDWREMMEASEPAQWQGIARERRQKAFEALVLLVNENRESAEVVPG